jgi:hypothetical protein
MISLLAVTSFVNLYLNWTESLSTFYVFVEEGNPVVSYGCETWSLPLREERRLRMFKNRVLSRIFGPQRDEVTGDWRKLHNEELNDLYSPNIFGVIKSRRMRWVVHATLMGEKRGVYRVLVWKPQGKSPLGIPRCTWEDNIKMDL